MDKRKGGRPSECKPEVVAEICASIRKCNTLEGSAKKAGISRSTLARWRVRAADGQEPYASLFHDIEIAEEETKEGLLGAIAGAVNEKGLHPWQASAELLKARYWEEYGKKQMIHHEVQNGVEAIMDALEKRVSRAAYQELVEALADLQGVREVENVGATEQAPGSNGQTH